MNLIGLPTGRTDKGYTLVEVLLSLFVLIAVAVPAITMFFMNNGGSRAQDSLSAIWLMEQTVETLRSDPGGQIPQVRKTINGVEWSVRVESSGSPLVIFKLSAIKKNRRIGDMTAYAFKKNGGRQ